MMMMATAKRIKGELPAGGPHDRCIASFTCSSQLEQVDMAVMSA
jgi:hypothetical protein